MLLMGQRLKHLKTLFKDLSQNSSAIKAKLTVLGLLTGPANSALEVGGPTRGNLWKMR